MARCCRCSRAGRSSSADSIVPMLWSGLLYSTLEPVNPLLASRIDWPWFMASQVAFGVVAGVVVVRRLADADARELSVRLARRHRGAGIDSAAEAERHGRERRSTALCIDDARGTLGVLLSGCGAPPGQPRTGSITLAPNEVVEFDALYADNCAGCHGAERPGRAGDRARQSRVPRDRRRTLDARDHRRRRARHVDAGLRAARRRHADGEADRCARRRHPIALEPSGRARWRAVRLRMPRRPRATFTGEKRRTRRSANRATARTVGAVRRAARSPTIRFWRWRAIRYLRTIVIAGRPELGAPDWRGYLAGTPDVGSGSHRRRELARLAPRASARPAVRRCARTTSVRSVTCRMKRC